MATTIIQTERLTKRYGSSRGIEDVSLSVNEGEVFGFLGPNGAGKTTTIRTLMGLLRPTSGRATIGGLDCWSQSPEVKKLVGYLPGEFTVDPNLTGAQILEYFGHLRGGVDQAYLKQLVERVGAGSQPALPSVFARQQAEGRARAGVHAQTAALDLRRANQWPRSTQPAGVLSHGRGSRAPRAHRLPVVAQPRRRSSRPAIASASSARASWCGWTT